MFLGFLLFLAVAGMAFWLLTFVISFLPYWIGVWFIETYRNRDLLEEEE